MAARIVIRYGNAAPEIVMRFILFNLFSKDCGHGKMLVNTVKIELDWAALVIFSQGNKG